MEFQELKCVAWTQTARLECLCEDSAAPLALDGYAPPYPALPRWANEFRRSRG